MDRHKECVFLLLFFLLFILSGGSWGQENLKGEVIGTPKKYEIRTGESLIEIARQFDLGYNAIVEANPGIDPFTPPPNAQIQLPTSWIIPDQLCDNGITINLAEMRLYLVTKRSESLLVCSFPVGIGSEGNNTPLGRYQIMEKVENPAWHVPASIRKENPDLPDIVPPGPENPLGTHALRLSLDGVLIHGTNRPFAIGRKVSHGCIRLYPEDIATLFRLVSPGLPVHIINQPIKVGFRAKSVFVEIHGDKARDMDLFDAALNLLVKHNALQRIDVLKLWNACKKKDGIPTDVSG